MKKHKLLWVAIPVILLVMGAVLFWFIKRSDNNKTIEVVYSSSLNSAEEEIKMVTNKVDSSDFDGALSLKGTINTSSYTDEEKQSLYTLFAKAALQKGNPDDALKYALQADSYRPDIETKSLILDIAVDHFKQDAKKYYDDLVELTAGDGDYDEIVSYYSERIDADKTE